ncbi:MAG: hypothetical protein M1540_01000 [Candidatus Bathyarchaeota archaeon]|nr:hypothetical protein [Candidatus Bathyarchaeota archaeon]
MEKKGVDTWFHIRMVAVSTCFYVERVKKNPYATPKQKPKHSPNPKRKRI